ncbi:type IX secretion system sortase PorU [Cytophaga hutchinsonii]|uniref:Gingipain domain-containing protein n=1 Tax=Cytophaga hutchinsonii (strain ATCC 33406 / DSM 1761 / CIP 103989 / NBRC 15051 / NCIMB 9469 / D465) TaxID=269798 RepID=A0A6N4SVD2_CYTH3|nr:type IX secretion system sortase PorU [Cytophaga hutchinsonii]ABG60477.1 conserved hypothetical protein [Cytophaga hutchinsonii ATCC 33406]SFX85110.1 Peptidase family C25 [Cytophaga hutchinsonii ATCC 33406]
MSFLKSIGIFLLGIFCVPVLVHAQQSSATFDIEWLGVNHTITLLNGTTITYPVAKDAFVNLDGVLVLQKDVVGKVSGTVVIENVTFFAGDSSSKSVLPALNVPENRTVTYAVRHNDGVTTRLYIPILQKDGAGNWAQLSSVSVQYSLTSNYDETPVRTDVYSRANANARTTNTTGSVLASGDWYKVAVSESGIYKITPSYLSSIGINTSSLDPSMIQLYGNGGGMLPQANSDARADDLVENAVFISEDGNGVFDNDDYILFYAESPHTWNYNPAGGTTFTHTLNLYSDQNFYFLTVNQQPGKRISSQGSLGGAAQTVSSFDEHFFTETDQYNIMDSGREWYGIQFTQYVPSQNFSFNITGILPNADLKLKSAVLSRSYVSTRFVYKVNNIANLIPDQYLPILTTEEHADLGRDSFIIDTLNAASLGSNTSLSIGMTLTGGIATSMAHLNYLEVVFEKSLRLYGNYTSFRSSKSLLQPTTQYSISNASGTENVWDVSNPLNVVNQAYDFTGSAIEFGSSSTSLKEFIIFSGNNFSAPTFIERVSNQNLHDITSGNIPDMIIVTHPDFQSQAQRLANFRTTNDGLRVYVCTTEQIYNEFGSGKKDLTAIRDFVKMVYDRGSAGSQLKYLLLFGKPTYDYKNHTGIGGNFVPTYESRESLKELQSYNSDDYFGFMDNTEGYWDETPLDDNTLNIGVGRLPIGSAAQGDMIVSKLINASKPSTNTNGNWKNKMTLLADDGDGITHLQAAEVLSATVNARNKQININKIYVDAYQQEATPGGETASLVNEAIYRDIEDGTLIWNYVGHGGNNVLAQEAIVTTTTINSWNNINKLPFFITATCSFGRFDKPGLVSGAENVLMSSNGGSFGNLTSTRTVYSFSNLAINNAFYSYAFLTNADGSYYTLGDIMKNTKNNAAALQGVYNRNYTLLGDPSMKISYPQKKMIIIAVNGTPVNSVPDTLKALSKVTLDGLVQDYTGTTLTSYSGVSRITIFDKPTTVPTLGSTGSSKTTFKLQNNIIFDGLVTVTNGAYKVSFIVPKDISYNFDYGKISLYSELTNGTTDAGGYLSNIVVGGSNANAPEDKIPPTVKLYLNDPSFVSGGVSRENPVFYADVADENGINVSAAGIGHEITLVLSNNSEVIILNKYYTASKDDYSKGKVEFPLKDLSPGTYSLRFKVWDTYNNSTEETLEFTIEATSKIQLSHVLNYPNPFTTNTTFHFDHNRFGDNLMVQVQIYTVSGKLVKTLDETIFNSPSHVANLTWDGLDDYGDKIGRGVYVYKLKIRSLQDGSTTHVFEKLVLLN